MQKLLSTRQAVLDFFKEKGLEYLSRPVYLFEKARELDWSTTPYYAANRPEFEMLTGRYAELIRQSFMAPIQMRLIGEAVGWGVFADADFEEGDFIGEYTGWVKLSEEVSPDEFWQGHYLSDYAWNYPDVLPGEIELEITALQCGNEMRFVNHSYQPNLVVDHTVVDGLFCTFFKTNQKIKKGEQLLVDYGEEYWADGFRDHVELR